MVVVVVEVIVMVVEVVVLVVGAEWWGLKFPGRLGPTGVRGLPAHRAGHSQDASQNHWHRRSPLHLQKSQLQVRL